MAQPRPLPPLACQLLARKGTARPAMQPRGLDPTDPDPRPGETSDDLGWNDMGQSPPPVLVEREALRVAIGRSFMVAPMSRTSPARPGRNNSVQITGAKIAFTLRLDPDRHRRLRLASAVAGQSSQHIVTQALDAFLHTLLEVDARVAQPLPVTPNR